MLTKKELVQSKYTALAMFVSTTRSEAIQQTQNNSFQRKEKKRAALGGIRTHDTLLSRQTLLEMYIPTEVPGQLGRGSNLQHKTMPHPLFVWVLLVLFKNCLAGW